MSTATVTATPVAAGTFAIDRTHSEVLFRVRHLLSRVGGQFRDFAGTFASDGVVRAGTDTFTVSGTLTIRGIGRRVELPVTYLGVAKDPWGNEKVAFEASIRLNRRDFGLTWNAALETGGLLVGDDVDVQLNVQATRS